MIDPKLETVSQLFKGDFQFVVPDYQRPYSWKSEEVGELVEDISACIGKDRGLYLGTVILDISDQKRKKIEIVDGQQRITSLFFLLIACRDHAVVLGESGRAQATQQKISFTDELESKTIGMKLLASSSIRKLFEFMADSSWDGSFPEISGKMGIRRVKPIYEYFRKQLKPLNVKQLGELQSAIYATEVIRIDIDGKDEAFAIFERTNARGMDLEVADLLKNFLHQHKLKTIQEDWQKIVKNASASMLRMLKAFYVSHRGPVQKSELYKNLKTFSVDSGGPDVFVDRLLKFSEFYVYLNSLGTNTDQTKDYFAVIGFGSVSKHQDRFVEVHDALQALKLFKVVQTQPLVFAAILAMERLGVGNEGKSAKVLVKLLRALESFHFINTYVCSHIGNEVESMYATACTTFGKATDFSKTTEAFIVDLKKKIAPRAEFKANFGHIEYSSNSLARLAYIFDRLNNYQKKVGEKKQIFYPDADLFRHHYNVEHIFAQTPNGVVGVGANPLITAVNNIGNLTVLSVQLNSELGNKSVRDKFKHMRGKAKSRVAEFPEVVGMLGQYATEEKVNDVQKEIWSDAIIEERAEKLADQAYGSVWVF